MRWLRQLKPILTVNQLKRLSNIFDNAGQVILGVVVLSPVITAVDKGNIAVLLLGLVGVIICWITSILLERRAESI